jgi:hypothetical protein
MRIWPGTIRGAAAASAMPAPVSRLPETMRGQAERPLEAQGAGRGIRGVRVPRVEARSIRHESQHLKAARAPGTARAA